MVLPPGAKAYEKAEDPIYALEHNLPIDVQHYLDHQLTQPLMRIFEPVCKDVKAELLSGEDVWTHDMTQQARRGLYPSHHPAQHGNPCRPTPYVPSQTQAMIAKRW
jgi:hypothetical protein